MFEKLKKHLKRKPSLQVIDRQKDWERVKKAMTAGKVRSFKFN